MSLRKFNSQGGKVAIITDTHIGARIDSLIFHDYFKQFYEEIFFPWIIKNNIKLILHLGDFTDRRKYINYVTLNRVRSYFINRLKELDLTIITTLGNHDTYFNNTNEINCIRELFPENDNIISLEEAEEVMIDKTKVLLVPWINQSNYDKTLSLIQNSKAKIAAGHLELKGFLMQRGMRAETGLNRELFEKFDAVWTGHYHHKSSEQQFHYLGPPYEMTWADLNDPRGFHEWNTNEIELVFHQNPLKMFHRIYYNDSRDKTLGKLLSKLTDKLSGSYVKVIVEGRTNPYFYEKYIEKLMGLNPAEVKIEENIQITEDDETKVDMTEDTLTILNHYVDSLEIDVNKDILKQEVQELFVKATNMEI